MVVVSGNWAKNVVHYSSSKINNDNNNIIIMEDTEIMHSTSAKAILECRPNSHQFQERFLTLEQPVKVGRSVARAKPTSNNAIFDCKVLSRHHAVLWYENGKFYLQDTKSSNGTFVNNNRLTTAGHEVSSGDIVQFGVDVLENNKKVTHGCIIATLKLFLPDGKEAKASPSITEGNIRGIVPFDDLYTLNQIIQEASQREQCLESKLTALQNVVDETKKSAEESWQAYVGEERLLSRLSALEIQLQQVKSNWSDDKLKEEIAKLRENNENYQEAAKVALEKVHAEKQQAVVLALEQERAKIAAEQDALLAREQLDQAHSEIQEIAQKITTIQNMADEEKRDHEKEVKQLQQQLEQEEAKITELESKIYELKVEAGKKNNYKGIEEFSEIICDDDVRRKETEILAENETMSELNKANLIRLSANNNNNQFGQFAPFLLPDNENEFEKEKFDDKVKCDLSLINSTEEEKGEKEKSEEIESESNDKNDDENCELKNNKDDGKRVSFNIPTDLEESENTESSSNSENEDETNKFPNDAVDSKTLKYQYQSAQREQIELRRKIGVLERSSETNKLKIVELNKALNEERDLSGQRLATCDHLKEELEELEKKWLESNEENKKLIERVDELVNQFDDLKNVKNDEEVFKISSTPPPPHDGSVRSVDTQCNNNNNQNNSYLGEESQNSMANTSSSVVSSEELTNIEEELVLFKERYAGICEEKLKLHKDLLKLKSQYDSLCDNMYNKYFWYIGPLVILIFYLLLKECIS